MTKKTSLVALALVVVAVGLGGYFYLKKPSEEAKAATAPAAKGKKGFDPNRATPVAVEAARKGELNLYITGLGTVTPLRNVVVRSRVDGELMQVHFKEGQAVRQGELLAEIDPRPFQVQLMQAEGNMARDQALLANARIDLERYQTLFRQDSIAKQQVDTQASLVRQYEAAIKTNQSAVENAKLQLTYSKVTAPISGRLGLRQVDQGNVVRAGDANGLVTITQQQPIGAVFTVPQDQISQILKITNQKEKAAVEAWDRENRVRIATGTLITVDNQIDTTTGTVKLKAEFPNTDGVLFPNQFVNIRMLVDRRADQTLVPTSALQRGAQGWFVYVVKEDSTVSMRAVRAGPAEGTVTAVESGVQPGERVVTDGLDRLRDGARVETAQKPAAENAPAGEKKGRRKKGSE